MKKEFLVSAYAGENDDERIAACLADAAGEASPCVVFAGRDFVISRAVLLSSGMRVLIDNCTIRQEDGAFDNVFRGANIRLDDSRPMASALSVDKLQNVSITGKGNAVIEGCSVNRRGYHPVLGQEQEMTGDFWGFRNYQVLFAMTDGLEIFGLRFIKTRSWAVTLDFCTDFHIHDIEVFSACKNGDGIHVLSGSHHGIIERIAGVTSDDTVAVESGFTIPCLPYKNYLASFTPMDKLYAGMKTEALDSHDIIIRDIKSGGKMHGIILLPLNGTSIYNVQIEDVYDTSRDEPYFATVFLYTGLYGEPGFLRDISVKRVSALADTAFVSNTTITNLLLSDIETRKEGGKLYGTFKYR